jgi:hypothetical protein
VDEEVGAEKMTEQQIVKMKLIADMHKSVLGNLEQEQQKQKKACALRKGKKMFPSLQ